MKKLILILLLCSSAYAQKHKLPDIDFNTTLKTLPVYYKELGIKDRNALIVTAGNTRNMKDGTTSVLVYSSTSVVRKFSVNNKENSVFEFPVSIEQSEFYWQLLNTCFIVDAKQINPYQLIYTQRNIITLDGSSDYFSIYQNKKSFNLNSSGTDTYIKAKGKGWEQRQKLLDLIKKFDDAFSQN